MKRDDKGKLRPTRGGALWNVSYPVDSGYRVTRVVEAWSEKGARRQVSRKQGVKVTRDVHTDHGWGYSVMCLLAWLKSVVRRAWKAWRNNDA
jgi:hypothetical protein